jgi:hypothetical protein
MKLMTDNFAAEAESQAEPFGTDHRQRNSGHLLPPSDFDYSLHMTHATGIANQYQYFIPDLFYYWDFNSNILSSSLPPPPTIDPNLIQLNANHRAAHPHGHYTGQAELDGDQITTGYSAVCRELTAVNRQQTSLDAQTAALSFYVTRAPGYADGGCDIAEAKPKFGSGSRVDLATTVRETGTGEFKCGFVGCVKSHDRRSRAQACEYRHHGRKPFQCNGACGSPNW